MRLLFTFILSFAFFSCQALNSDQYTIKGKIVNSSSQTIYLEKLSHQEIKLVDSSKVSSEGNFKLSGNIEGRGLYRLKVINPTTKQNYFWLITLKPGETVKIELDNANPNQFEVNGSDEQSEFHEFLKISTLKQTELSQLFNQYQNIAKSNPNSNDAQSLAKLIQSKAKQFNDLSIDYLNKSAGPITKYFIYSNLLQSQRTNPLSPTTIESMKAYYEELKKNMPNSVYTADFKNVIDQQTKQEQQANIEANLSPGAMAPDIELKRIDGKMVKISDYKGKIVLLDFWASWCRPCRQENPNVVHAFKKYSPEGFVVLSISQDRKLDHWKKAIEQDGLYWGNHFADIESQNIGTKTYNISYIPKTFLLDREGKIVATDLRGPALDQEIEKLLKK